MLEEEKHEEKHKQIVGKAGLSGSAWDLKKSLSTRTGKKHTGSEGFRPI